MRWLRTTDPQRRAVRQLNHRKRCYLPNQTGTGTWAENEAFGHTEAYKYKKSKKKIQVRKRHIERPKKEEI